MPAGFQRLTDATRIITLRRTNCDGLVALLDDFLGVTHRRPLESELSVMNRACSHARAFDIELLRLGLTRNTEKDLAPCTSGVWLGINFDMETHHLSVPLKKIRDARAFILAVITDNTGIPPSSVKAGELQSLVGKLAHMSSTWVLGKILLWPLYQCLSAAFHFV